MSIQDMDEMTLRAADMPFSTTSASGHVIPLTTRVSHITIDNRSEYVRLALAYRSPCILSITHPNCMFCIQKYSRKTLSPLTAVTRFNRYL